MIEVNVKRQMQINKGDCIIKNKVTPRLVIVFDVHYLYCSMNTCVCVEKHYPFCNEKC